MTRTPLQVALAEFLGTGFLVCAVVGSGIAASRLSPHDAGLELLENSLATGAALTALIVALQPISAAFNPVVTLLEVVLGGLSARLGGLSIGAQVLGGAVGAIVANAMFGLSAISPSHHQRTGADLWLGELVATLGLLVVIFGAARSGRSSHVPYAVGAYIAAAYWFTSSTSFANPAVTLARTLTNSFSGIAARSAPMFVLMQLGGALAAYAVVRALYPHPHVLAKELADA
jgi:glycerol uptake facilitator-like aquaporin